MIRRSFETISPAALAAATGGRITPRTTLDPVLLQGFDQLSQAIVSLGQNLAAAKQSASQQVLQMMQQVMQGPSGA